MKKHLFVFALIYVSLILCFSCVSQAQQLGPAKDVYILPAALPATCRDGDVRVDLNAIPIALKMCANTVWASVGASPFITSVTDTSTIDHTVAAFALSSDVIAGSLTNTHINASAAINASKIADGSVSSIEFQYINSLSSNAQTQLDSKEVPLTFSAPLNRLVNTITIPNSGADGSTKGAASFTAADFDASSGNISIDYTNGQAAATGAKGFLTSTDWNTFNGKQASGNYITALTGEVTASGPGSVAATVPNATVIGKVLTGYTSGSGTVASTDTILQGIQKLNGNDVLKQPLATLTTKGDVYVATGSSTVARQAIGSDGQVLTADSAQTNGLKWAAASTAPPATYEISNCSLATSVSSNALTIALKDQSGANPSAGSPCKIGFRNATIATGTYDQVSTTGALSVVVSSGSTLGCISAIECRLYIYAINNAGTVELGIANGALLDEGAVFSSTAEGGAGAADSSNTVYSTTARSSKALRIIGRLKITETTAGTWASNATEIANGLFSQYGLHRPVSVHAFGSTTTVGTSATTIINPSKSWDTHNAYNTSTGAFVVPAAEAGIYTVCTFYLSDNQNTAFTGASQVYLDVAPTSSLTNGGSTRVAMFNYQVHAATQFTLNGCRTVQLNAGDSVVSQASRSSDVVSFNINVSYTDINRISDLP